MARIVGLTIVAICFLLLLLFVAILSGREWLFAAVVIPIIIYVGIRKTRDTPDP